MKLVRCFAWLALGTVQLPNAQLVANRMQPNRGDDEAIGSHGSSAKLGRWLQCNRDWSRHGFPLACRLQLPLVSKRGERQRLRSLPSSVAEYPRRSLRGKARSCGSNGCNVIVFFATLWFPTTPAGRSNTATLGSSIAEAYFDVPLFHVLNPAEKNTNGSDVNESLILEITLARLNFVTKLQVSEGPSDGNDFERRSQSLFRDASLQAKLLNGALHLNAPVPSLLLTSAGVHKLRVSGSSVGVDNQAKEVLTACRHVRIEVGAPLAVHHQALPPSSLHAGPADLVVVLEPHLGRWSQYVHLWQNNATATAGRAAAFGSARHGNGAADVQLVVLPAAVQAADTALAQLAQNSPGPEIITDASVQLSEVSEAVTGTSKKHTVWHVPTVALKWVLQFLVPSLAPNVTSVSLVLRRSGTVGSPWVALAGGLLPSDRAHLSRLSVEWSPTDEVTCVEAAQAIFDEGFVRRGPLLCETERPVDLNFQRAAPPLPPTVSMPLSVEVASGMKTASDLPVVVQHRFSTSRVHLVRSSAEAGMDMNAMAESFSVQLPEFFELWISACSPQAAGLMLEHPLLETPLHARVFLLSLEPRILQWLELMAKAEGNLPPGWAHMRHLVMPVSIYQSQPNASSIAFASLSWSMEVLFGARDVALLVLRDVIFNTQPWVASGGHARRFQRVRLESVGNETDMVAKSCKEAKRLAAQLGYGLVHGDCSKRESHKPSTFELDVMELLFERMG